MNCCFSSHILTRAEREAIARLREQRATGKSPIATTHRAPHYSHPDPIVTFYTNRSKPLPPPKPRPPRKPATPHTRPHGKPKTAHQQKKETRLATKRVRANPDKDDSRKPPAALLMEKLRKAKWDTNRSDTEATSGNETTSENKENSLYKFKAATKKRFEGVKNKFANNSPEGERFVIQQPPNADTTETNNDRYFQDLMNES